MFRYRDAWYLDYTDVAGKRVRRKLGANKRTAELARVEIVHQRDLALLGLGGAAGLDLRLSEILAPYIRDLALRSVGRHTKNVAQRLSYMVELLGDPRVRDLRAVDVLQVRNHAVEEGKAPRTANLLVDRLRAMLAWAVANGLLDANQNPLRHVKRLPDGGKHERRKQRALSDAEIERFLRAAAEDDAEQSDRFALHGKNRMSAQAAWHVVGYPVRVPQAALWRALLETGGRYGELTRVCWRDLDLDGALLRLPEDITKNGRARAIPLLAGLVGELRALLPIHERVLGRVVLPGDRVFLSPAGKPYSWATTNLKRQFARLLERGGIPRDDDQGRRIDVHALRHSFASRLARAGVGLVHAQRLMGHSDPRLTAKAYTHLDIADLRGAVEAIGGGAGASQQRRVQAAETS